MSRFSAKGLTLGQANALVKKLGGKEVVDQILADKLEFRVVESEKSPLLELVDIVNVSPVERFVVRKKFRMGTADGVQIGGLGDDFRHHFFGKVEENVEEANLRVIRLTRDAYNEEMLTAAAECIMAKTTLAHVWELLKRQRTGQDGILRTDGFRNIFFIRGVHGHTRVLSVRWYMASGLWWGINSYALGLKDGWLEGDQILSP